MASGQSTYLENKLIDHIFRATSYTMPSTIYIGLCTTTPVNTDTGTNLTSGTGGTGIEVSTAGTGYTRVAYNPSATSDWTATQGGVTGASSGTTGNTSNNTVITFPVATANWGAITSVAICDAATNGNLLFFGTLAGGTLTVNSGATFSFGVNQLLCNFA